MKENDKNQLSEIIKNSGSELSAMLLPLFYERNFGQTSKSQFELIMFKYFLDCLEKSELSLSNYEIGYYLGITEKKVGLLKEKIEFQFREYDEKYLKNKVIDLLQRVIFDEKKALVKVLVNDVSLMLHIRQKLESLGLYDEYQLNSKLFQCRPEVFLVFLSSLDFRGIGNSKASLIAILSDLSELDGDNAMLPKVINNLEKYEDEISPSTLAESLKTDLLEKVPFCKETLRLLIDNAIKRWRKDH